MDAFGIEAGKRLFHPGGDDPRTAARSLIAAADGLTMCVLIGSLPAAEAERTLRIEVDRIAT